MLIVGIESLQTIQRHGVRIASFVYRVINVISAEPTTAVKSFDVCLVPARRVNETAGKLRSKLEGEEEIEEIESLFTLWVIAGLMCTRVFSIFISCLSFFLLFFFFVLIKIDFNTFYSYFLFTLPDVNAVVDSSNRMYKYYERALLVFFSFFLSSFLLFFFHVNMFLWSKCKVR